MTSPALLDNLRSWLPDVQLDERPSVDQPSLVVPAAALLSVCQALHDRAGFVLLSDITAVDWWPKEPRYEVVYHLASATGRVRLIVLLPSQSARVPSIQRIWMGANWLEREVWDLFGIDFDGHGDLRRLLMPEDWEGHPLRKDYPVQIRLKPRVAEPLQISEEEFRANLLRDKHERRTDGAR